MPLIIDRHPAPTVVTLACDDAPEAARVRWALRPLTPAELQRVREEAGPVNVRGRRVMDALRKGETSLDALPPEDDDAYDAAAAWTLRHHEHLARLALVSVDGEPVGDDAAAWLQAIRPASLYPLVVLELGGHVQALSELGPKGRACYGSPSGCGGTGAGEDGGAASAQTRPC